VEDRSTGNLTRRLLIRRAVCECVVYSSGSVEPYVKRYGVIPGIHWAIEIISSAVPQYQGVVERFSSPGNEVEPPPTHGGPVVTGGAPNSPTKAGTPAKLDLKSWKSETRAAVSESEPHIVFPHADVMKSYGG
jgi:hypothetical protein